MFKNNMKYAICIVVETILPWLVSISGFLAFLFCDSSHDTYNGGDYGPEHLEYESLFLFWYNITYIIGWIVVLIEWILSMISFIAMIINITNKAREKYSIIKPFVNWLYSGFCILGTSLLMLLVHAFTYGMGV